MIISKSDNMSKVSKTIKIGEFSFILNFAKENKKLFSVENNSPFRIDLIKINNYSIEKNPSERKLVNLLDKQVRKKLQHMNNVTNTSNENISIIYNKKSFDVMLSNEINFIKNCNSSDISNISDISDKIIDIISNEYIELWSFLVKNNKGIVTIRNNSIFQWNIKLSEVKINNSIDFSIFEQKYGYKYVEINIDINKNYYPLEPPSVYIIRPIFKNLLSSRISNSKRFSTKYWTPSTTLKQVTSYIFDIIEKYGELDIQSEYNNLQMYPEGIYGTYGSYDFYISKLSSLIMFNCDDIIDKDFMKTKNNTHNKNNDNNDYNDYNKLGTGFSNKDCIKWNRDEYMKMIATRKTKIKEILDEIISKIKINEINCEKIRNSILFKYIHEELKSCSLKSIEYDKETCDIFIAIFSLLQLLCSVKEKNVDFFTEPYDNISISELINGLYSDCIDRLDDGFISSDIVDIIISLHKNICTVFKLEPIQNKSNNILQNNYYDIMRKYTFRKCKNIHNFNPFTKTYNYDTSMSSQRIKALSIELPTLKKEAYSNFGESGIRFYLIDKTKCKMRVLLIGSNDTPYENGCFLFDIYIPPEYKIKPPTIRLINNPSSVLLNYNIYGDGQVCISLLESYRGEKIDDSEKWDPKTSSIEQIMISIQSSIFNDKPHFNEQGHYTLFATDEGKKRSDNANISYTLITMKFMILQTLNDIEMGKYQDFKEVIIDHYRLVKDRIINTCDKWCIKSGNSNEHCEIYDKIKLLLRQL
jgi:ubiquitin-protein ligase